MVYRAFRSCCSFFVPFMRRVSKDEKNTRGSLSHLLIGKNVSALNQSAIAMGRYGRSDLSRVIAVRQPGSLDDTISGWTE